MLLLRGHVAAEDGDAALLLRAALMAQEMRVVARVAAVKELGEPLRRKRRMLPRWAGRVEPVEIAFADQAGLRESIVLLRSGDRREYVERSHLRTQRLQDLQVVLDLGFVVLRKADDVGEMRADARLPAQPHDVGV